MKDAAPTAIYLEDYQAPQYFIRHTELQVELFDEHTLVSSVLSLENNSAVSAAIKQLYLDGRNLELISVAIDNRPLAADEYSATDSSLCIENPPNTFQLAIVTKIKPQENTSLEGLYRSGNKYCTQCEAEGFRGITYYLDRPDVMSEFTTTIVADKAQFPVLLSNGNPVASGDCDDGRHWQKWHDPFLKPCYLFALVAGDLVSVDDKFVTQSGRQVALKLYVEEKDTDKCRYALTALKNAMAWDEQVYGREYDLDLFMIVAVDDFNMGAMENKGLNIFNTSCVLAQAEITTDRGFQRVEAVVAHEYFHNWSGNRVTCRDWFQLSLKEGFTVFRDSQFSADMGSATVKRVEDVTLLRTMQFAEDSGPLAHPVQPPSFIEISNFYTLTIYEKGAEIVRMIYNLLGPDRFRQGSDLYFSRHDGQAVTIDEFVQAMADVSDRDFGQFKRWYTQAGTPTLTITDDYDGDTQCYRLQVTQTCPPTPESAQKHPFHIPLAMGLVDENGGVKFDDGSTHRVLEITEAEQSFEFNNIERRPVPSLLRNFSAPVRLNFRYSPSQLVTVITQDSDGFCRWDAMQTLATSAINKLVDVYPDFNGVDVDSYLLQVVQQLLNNISEDNISEDKAMIALMLQLPSEAYLSELASEINVDGIHHGREYLQRRLAEHFGDDFLKLYNQLDQQTDYQSSAEQIANRSLKNTALKYLSLRDENESYERCVKQFNTANNMTDYMAALQALLNSSTTQAKYLADQCLQSFYQRFEHEPLAIDQWLVVQATANGADSLDRVKQLGQHPCFSLTNPNKVRSVIGAFCANNLVNFHRRDGAGYQFLSEQVIALNRLNPQIASRLLTPLTRWRKYDQQRQDLMTQSLRHIAEQGDLSRDVFEVVNKSLAQA